MVERRSELNARYHRKKKMRKLKAKLNVAGVDREKILYKIKRLSPAWTEASLTQGQATAPSSTASAPSDAPKKKAPPVKKKQ